MLKRFGPDEIVFRQGDPSDFAILILSGSVDVLRDVGDEAIVLGTVQAGEFVGGWACSRADPAAQPCAPRRASRQN